MLGKNVCLDLHERNGKLAGEIAGIAWRAAFNVLIRRLRPYFNAIQVAADKGVNT